MSSRPPCSGWGARSGEAIAVSYVIGNATGAIHASLFQPGDSLAALIATEFPNPDNSLHTASMFYLAVVLLVIGLLTTLARARDRRPVRRADKR